MYVYICAVNACSKVVEGKCSVSTRAIRLQGKPAVSLYVKKRLQ